MQETSAGKPSKGVKRCVNIDWLELYVLEPVKTFPLNAEYFERKGYIVRARDYGTRNWREMFTIFSPNGEPFLEVRRNPVSNTAKTGGIFPPNAAHVRLTNNTCYLTGCVDRLRSFLAVHNYEFRKIFRIDICLDFERFDLNDDPQKFLMRYIEGKYSKVNQTNLSAHGTDTWTRREFNSISWGKPSSMVGTKLYCKTLELEQVHDKPYIKLAWFNCGLIDHPVTAVKYNEDGTTRKPLIWRVEFSIKSSANKWFVIKSSTRKKTDIYMPHALSMYDTPAKLLTIFSSLAQHYFRFKIYEEGVRKDRCKDKVLFKFSPSDTFFRVDRLASHTANTKPEQRLEALLRNFYTTHPVPEVYKAVNVLIDFLQKDMLTKYTHPAMDGLESLALQLLIKYRQMHHNTNSPMKELEDILNELKTNPDYF